MCKKQTSVSHSSTESEIISLDVGLRLDSIPALDLLDLIVAFLGNTYQSHKEQGDPCTNLREIRSRTHTIQKRKQSQGAGLRSDGLLALELWVRLLRDRGDPLSLTRVKDLKGRPTC